MATATIGQLLKLEADTGANITTLASDSDTARGTAADTAIEALTAGQMLLLSPGDYQMPNADCIGVANTHLVGAAGGTTLFRNGDFRLRPRDGMTIENIKFGFQATSNYGLYLSGSDGSGTVNTRIRNCRFQGLSDLLFTAGDYAGVWNSDFFNCSFETPQDASANDVVLLGGASASGLIRFFNCDFHSQGAASFLDNIAVEASGSYVFELYGCTLHAHPYATGGQDNACLQANQNATIRAFGCHLKTTTNGSTPVWAATVTGANSVIELYGCHYDPTLLQAVGSGVISNIKRYDDRRALNLAAASQTLKINQSGQLFIGAVDAVFTLPAASASTKGMIGRFMCGADSSGTGLSISPNASDHIRGNGFTSVDDKDLINSGGSDRVGDYVEIVCDGVDGWVITSIIGTWAKE